LNPFGRPSDAYSDALRSGFERLCSHSPYNPLSVRRRSNPSLGLGERRDRQQTIDIFLRCSRWASLQTSLGGASLRQPSNNSLGICPTSSSNVLCCVQIKCDMLPNP
jgi:hypothetical protein